MHRQLVSDGAIGRPVNEVLRRTLQQVRDCPSQAWLGIKRVHEFACNQVAVHRSPAGSRDMLDVRPRGEHVAALHWKQEEHEIPGLLLRRTQCVKDCLECRIGRLAAVAQDVGSFQFNLLMGALLDTKRPQKLLKASLGRAIPLGVTAGFQLQLLVPARFNFCH